MLRLYSNIKITSATNGSVSQFSNVIEFNFVNEASTEESWENLTDYFKLVFPRNINRNGENIFSGENALLKRGDEIEVSLGYYPNLERVFKGHIVDISSKLPLEIKCQDDMYLLKNTNIIFPTRREVITSSVSKTGRTTRLKKPRTIVDTYSLDDLLDSILPEYIQYECLDMQLAKRAYTNVSVSRILEDLRSTYGLYSYFRENEQGEQVLHVGFASDASTGVTHTFEFEKNIIDDSNLEYQQAEDISYKVILKVINENNEVTEYTYGDTDGSQRTVHVYSSTTNPISREVLDKMGNDWVSKYKYTGYKGSFTAFGEPVVRHGDIVKLTSRKLPERDGNYLVKGVKRSFGVNGYRQEIFVDAKV